VVTKKNTVFWDVTPCCSCKNQHFRGMYHLHHQGEENQRARTVTANAVHSAPILFTLMMMIRFSKQSNLKEPRGVTSQKMAFFMFNFVFPLNF
jgi:hypothetical protein